MTARPYQAYGQDVRDRSFEFACQIVSYCDDLMKCGGVGRILAPQMLRCGTSIGANPEEARGGEPARLHFEVLDRAQGSARVAVSATRC